MWPPAQRTHGGRLGTAEQEALAEFAAQLLQRHGLIDRLDAFGHDGDPQLGGERDDRAGDGRVARA